ncbi:MAG: leucyl/phenylalanyl-tRNA--protein transferase, partial [Candidatus Binatia bacterium]
MSSIVFPDPHTYDFPEWLPVGDYMYYAHDIVAFDVPLTVENLRTAYRNGIFPWHINGIPLPWFCPEKRAILEFTDLSIPRSLVKERRKNLFTFTIDKAFCEVIENCAAKKRPDQGGTWITKDFIRAYCDLHDVGMAHSIEAWDANGDLAGGLYGVDAGGVFCGESMFYKQPNASKLALLFLIDHLRSRGSTWLDAQVMTPHMKALGATEISRKSFLDKLKDAQTAKLSVVRGIYGHTKT